MKDVIRDIKYILNVLDGFTEEELESLVNNEARLAIIYNDSSEKHNKEEKKKNSNETNLLSIIETIDEIATTEEAHKYLDSLKLTKRCLKEIAAHYKISVTTRDTNSILKKKIVDGVIGSKIKFQTLLDTN